MSTDLFSALNINTAEESLYISKFKFIQRMERNEYTKQFMGELREKIQQVVHYRQIHGIETKIQQ